MRNKAATKQRLIDAISALLQKNGFKALGINAIARQAGVDKVLIYRYFDGLPGLLDAYAQDSDFWWTVDELIPETDEQVKVMSLPEFLSLLLKRHIRALKRRPLTQEIMAWELVESNELTRAVALLRSARGFALLKRVRQHFDEAAVVDIENILGILGAAVNYLALKTRQATDADKQQKEWQNLENSIDNMLSRLVAH
ncbi:MAG: TetR/AcrR family transcriptional regulator [Gammaproteobacteria bacterium]|nr:TetR/AcrR family transcriptional regulator [Gammaproteobacteria bacterium]